MEGVTGTAAAENSKEIRDLQLEGHVGIDSIPDQHVKKENNYVFNVLCIGETGIGKTTLIDSLFSLDADGQSSSLSNRWSPSASSLSTSRLSPLGLLKKKYDLTERGVELKLTVVESVGYGDQLNKEETYKAIEGYIDEQFEAYFTEELKVERCLPLYKDTRIHACLYFISPTGNGIKTLDLLCMKKLHEKVHIIPVIGKSDCLQKAELKTFKNIIMSELKSNGVKIYDFPLDDDCETCKALSAELPFAVVASCDFVRVGNKLIRGRNYPWGIVEVENENHCDFVRLREMLVRTNMVDLQQKTHAIHYEKYRKERLVQMGFSDDGESFQEMFKQKLHLQFQEQSQQEEDIRQKFLDKLREKYEDLKDTERQVWKQCDEIKETYLRENRTIEELMKLLEDEIDEFRVLTEQYVTQQHSQLTKAKSPNSSIFYIGPLGKMKKTANNTNNVSFTA